MKASEAVAAVNGMIFRPGWKLSAREVRLYGPDHVRVVARVTTVDTSYPTPEGEYKVPLTSTLDTVLDVSDLDLAGLCHAIITWAEMTDPHEDREFLRIWDGGRWTAPLHPHTEAGERAWERVTGRSSRDELSKALRDLLGVT